MAEYYITGNGQRIYKDPAKQRAYLKWLENKELEKSGKLRPQQQRPVPVRQKPDDGYDIVDGERIYHDPAKQARWMKFLKEKEAQKAANERDEFENAYSEDNAEEEYTINQFGDRQYYDPEKQRAYEELIKRKAREEIEHPKDNTIFSSQYRDLDFQYQWEEKEFDSSNFEMEEGDYDLGDKEQPSED